MRLAAALTVSPALMSSILLILPRVWKFFSSPHTDRDPGFLTWAFNPVMGGLPWPYTDEDSELLLQGRGFNPWLRSLRVLMWPVAAKKEKEKKKEIQ